MQSQDLYKSTIMFYYIVLILNVYMHNFGNYGGIAFM